MLHIIGSIDSRFNGYSVFFRPQPYPTEDIVVESVIKDGKFEFFIPADSVYIADVMLSRSAHGNIEKLLLVVEPGELEMHLDRTSRSSGTPLNDTLQNWKDFIVNNIQTMKMSQINKAQELFEERTVSLIKNNLNPLGAYIFLLNNQTFSQQNIVMLDSLQIYKFMPDVTKRPVKK